MCLDNKVAVIEKSKNTFDYWIKLSTLNKGKPIYLPIKSYDYFERAEGAIKKQVQIIIKKDKIEYGFVKESIDKKYIPKKEEKIVGVDLGMCVLLSSSEGNLYGKGLYGQLKKIDGIITNIVSKRQKNGLKNSCPKVDRLYRKMKSLINNEVGRVLNKLLSKEKPDIVVIENLTRMTQNTGDNYKLRNRTKRVLNNCGITKIPKSLDTKSRRIGFKVEKINPAFTSQECPKCHSIDSKNRKDQAHFVCTKCGYKRNADYVGSVNIRDRRSISSINIYTPYKSVQGLIRAFYGLDQPLSNKPHYSPAVSSKSSAKKRRLITIKEEC